MIRPEVVPGNVVVQLAMSGVPSERVPVQPAPSPENETEPVGTPAPGAETLDSGAEGHGLADDGRGRVGRNR